MRAADSEEQGTEHYGIVYVDPRYSDLVAVVGREVWGAGSLDSTQQNKVWPGPPGLQAGKDETSLSPQLWGHQVSTTTFVPFLPLTLIWSKLRPKEGESGISSFSPALGNGWEMAHSIYYD